MIKNLLLIICVVFFSLIGNAYGQILKIKGRVTDESNGNPVLFASIVVKGSLIGTSSDTSGKFNFTLNTGRRHDTLSISAIGYQTQLIALSPLAEQYLDIQLTPSVFNIGEATIHAGENPAFEVLRRVIANKPFNNPELKSAYEYEVYHKVEFDLNNFTDKIKQNIFLRSFSFIFDNADTTEDGVTYLPVLFNESLSDIYYRKNPPLKKELVKGRRSVGLKGPKIMQFAQDMYLYPNVYDNYVIILDKNFPSPLNDNYQSNYKFMLLDSLQFKGRRCYYLKFKPKVKGDVAFTGEMYIEDSTYSVVQIDLEFSITANVNFVRNYWIRQEYDRVDGIHNMITKSQVIGDFTVVENSKELTGFFGRKTSVYRNYKINQPRDESFYRKLDLVTYQDSAETRDENFWNETRGDSLTKQEQSVFSMIDTLEQEPKFVILKNVVTGITSGWFPVGKIEIGNYYEFYSYNDVERSRVKLGMRAMHLFNDHAFLKSYLAYGTYDERFKYMVEPGFVFSKHGSKRNIIGALVRKDAIQPGRSSNIFALDNVFNSFIGTAALKYRSFAEDYAAYFERQWMTGFSTRLSSFHTRWEPFGDYQYMVTQENNTVAAQPSFAVSGFQLSARFAFGERNLSAKFGDGLEGLYLPKYPVISFTYIKGIKNYWQGEFNTDKLKLRVEERLRTGKFGYSLIRAEAGKSWGVLPWTFLETPFANQIVLNDETAYNLMNYLEFVSDSYLSVMYEHHFEGLLFNRLPLIKKLKWREILFAKFYAGSLSDENKNSIYLRPAEVSYLDKPYLELGFGIENIFKISRVDFIWRLTYTDKPGVYYFIAKPMFQFKF